MSRPQQLDRLSEVDRAIRDVLDPEIPVITIDDLGIVRDVAVDEGSGSLQVTITPTYSGCPAMRVIAETIEAEAGRHGFSAEVLTRLSPPWTTEWISDRGRESLRRFGIAPPGERDAGGSGGPVVLGLSRRQVSCPQCGSSETEEISHFGATACKALRRCVRCREPFEEFKAL